MKTFMAIVLIHSLCAAYRLFPTLDNSNPLTFFIPLGELIIVFVMLSLSRYKKTTFCISIFILSFLVFFISGEMFFRLIYLEHFDMIADMQLIPNFFVMLLQGVYNSAGLIKAVAVILSIILTVLLAWGLLVLIKKTAEKEKIFSNRRLRLALILIAIPLILLFPTGSPFSQTFRMMIENSKKSSHYISLATIPDQEELPDSAILENEPDWEFPAIMDSDIHFVVIESYGATLFQNPKYVELMQYKYQEMQNLLDKTGLAVKSGYVRSPAFGGRSWLADATLLTGVQIANQKMYDERVNNGETAFLLDKLRQAGYASYYVAPGSSHASEKWKVAYPFDNYILTDNFNYDGPFISFGYMSDQYMYHYYVKNHLNNVEKQFAFYLLVSAHTPFERIPVYKEDWDFSQNGREYSYGHVETFENNWLHGNELAEGYLAGIDYSLTTTIHYLTEKLTGNNFMLIIGDHQPRIPVSGPNPGYPVLFHIIFQKEFNLTFPENWTLSSTLIPPKLPTNYKTLHEMAAIPYLILQVITQRAQSPQS